MDEALFARLTQWLADDRDVVVASVIATHGATPRKRGARMLIDARDSAFSVGGGAMEARVVEAARDMIRTRADQADIRIELNGRAGAAGVCGGGMRVVLRRWQGEAAWQHAQQIASRLAAGESIRLQGEVLGLLDDQSCLLQPKARLLILGAGHCGQALAELARFVDFEVWLADSRAECFSPDPQEGVICIGADAIDLRAATDTPRALYLVLLNRDYLADVAALNALNGVRYAFLGMMGSRKRIAQVKKSLPDAAPWLEGMVAPVGVEIGEQTPQEIAVSIVAELIACRARMQTADA